MMKKNSITHTQSENIQILTVLPMSWSHINSNNPFKTLNFMALASKKLVAETAVFLSPNAKPSHILPPATSNIVKQFHTADAICKIMPGTKYYICLNSRSKRFNFRNG